MSDYSECTQCGAVIEEAGIQYRGKFFCSDDCCEQYEQAFLDKDEPVLDELDIEEDDIEITDEDLDFQEDDEEEDLLDDDFDIKPEDF